MLRTKVQQRLQHYEASLRVWDLPLSNYGNLINSLTLGSLFSRLLGGENRRMGVGLEQREGSPAACGEIAGHRQPRRTQLSAAAAPLHGLPLGRGADSLSGLSRPHEGPGRDWGGGGPEDLDTRMGMGCVTGRAAGTGKQVEQNAPSSNPTEHS